MDLEGRIDSQSDLDRSWQGRIDSLIDLDRSWQGHIDLLLVTWTGIGKNT